MAETDYTYGPERPERTENYTDYRTAEYISGHASKIIHDLEKATRLYNGKISKIFRRSDSGPCPDCVDTLTGAIMVNDCPTCGGTGRVAGYTELCEKWVRIDIPPEINTSTEFGNADSSGGANTPITVIAAPILEDQDVIITINGKEVFKVVDMEPQLVGMQGVIITQLVNCYRISHGSPEHKLITW